MIYPLGMRYYQRGDTVDAADLNTAYTIFPENHLAYACAAYCVLKRGHKVHHIGASHELVVVAAWEYRCEIRSWKARRRVQSRDVVARPLRGMGNCGNGGGGTPPRPSLMTLLLAS